MTHVTFRPFVDADQARCLEIFQSNVPKYFDPEERDEYIQFLSDNPDNYLVMELEGEIIGCGGYFLKDKTEGLGGISWGMVHSDQHGGGFGKTLLMRRLSGLEEMPEIKAIHIDTSQHTAPFFEKYGFSIIKITKGFYGPEIDKVELRKTVRD